MSNTETNPQLDVLRLALPRLLGNLDEPTFKAIRPHLAWQAVELAGGEVLFRQGDPSDALYLLLTGRLEAIVERPGDAPEKVGEIGRGESVGEMGVFSGNPRQATVVALRDSVLARIELATFRAILEAAPALALNLNRLIIERLQRRNLSHKPGRNVTNIAVVGVSEGLVPGEILEEWMPHLKGHVPVVRHLTSASIDAVAGYAGAAQATDTDKKAHYWLANYLDELEGSDGLIFYEADPGPTEWTRRCLRQADEVLLLGRAGSDPELCATERVCLSDPKVRIRPILVLTHSSDTAWAEGTLPFLARRPNVQKHFHLRDGNEKDRARLARFLTGNAIGLVLAGGGARGLAHIGVYRALEEAGVTIDLIGGTSIGSVLGACMACDWSWEKVYQENKREFLSNPTSDFNLIPLVSILAGRKLHRILSASFADRHIEEMWVPYFCVSSNYTWAREEVHLRGELRKAVMASMALPGVFPPIVSGNDLLVDGGVFNNMPVDVMARTGVKTIIAVDLRPGQKQPPKLAFNEVPDWWTLVLDRFRSRARRRYGEIPSMMTTLMAANTLNSEEKMSQVVVDVDLLFKPDVRRFGLLEWKSFDLLVDQGYKHAREVLAKTSWPLKTS